MLPWRRVSDVLLAAAVVVATAAGLVVSLCFLVALLPVTVLAFWLALAAIELASTAVVAWAFKTAKREESYP